MRDFHSTAEIVFAEASESVTKIKKIHGVKVNAGDGGWPTIRHFNSKTGYGGKPYKKKGTEPMCDELGPKTDILFKHIEEVSGFLQCGIKNAWQGCNEKQKTFITEMGEKTKDELQGQIHRLEGMAASTKKKDDLKWVNQRLSIIKQLHQKDEL